MAEIKTCPSCGASSEEDLIIEKRFLFWNIKITNPLGLKKYNYWSVIPVSISKAGVKRILEVLKIQNVPEELIRPIKIPDIGDARYCSGCGDIGIQIGKQ